MKTNHRGDHALLLWAACILFLLIFLWPSRGQTQTTIERFIIGKEYGDVFLSTCVSVADIEEVEGAAPRGKVEVTWDRKVAANRCSTTTWHRVRYVKVISTIRGVADDGDPATLYFAEVHVRKRRESAWERRYTVSSVPIVSGSPVVEF